MKKSQQSTLFQTWGYADKEKNDKKRNKEKKEIKQIKGAIEFKGKKPEKQNQQKDDIINLDDFDDDDIFNNIDTLDCQQPQTSSNRNDKQNHIPANRNQQHNNNNQQDQTTRHQNNEKQLQYKPQEIYLDPRNKNRTFPHENIPGFDEQFGSTYIYPTNYPIRDYQFNIVKKALIENTLVVLPTGLGKTFIAAVVMYNFYRWYPQRKLIFMAPTKPLVAQQIEACYKIMGIPPKDSIEMTGNIAPTKREIEWKNKRVFFMTPQVLQNDLARGSCNAADIVCLVFDEAHKALGSHAYSQVIREVNGIHQQFRVLALSATPGDNMNAVQEVINNLMISHIELRSEESIDIQKYVHERKVEKIVVPLSGEVKNAQEVFLEVLQSIVLRLFSRKAIWSKDASKVSKFMLLKAREQWRANNAFQDRTTAGYVEGDFALLMSLYHAYDLLQQHGLLSFYTFIKALLSGSKGTSKAKMELNRNEKLMNLMEDLHSRIEPEDGNQSLNETIVAEKHMTPKQRLLKSIPKPRKNFVSHPKMVKLEEIVVQHFQSYADKMIEPCSSQTPLNTRVMIFSQFRDSVQEITAVLSRHEPLVKCMSFIGQGSKDGVNNKTNKGLSQKEQIEILRRFRAGGYNTVVSTCVGEEGLDIGDVDLIVCFDASNSPIRLVQRMGRTGRKRKGRIVILVGEGKEEMIYKKSLSNKKGIHKNLCNAAKSLVLNEEAPRMIPKHLNPTCYQMKINIQEKTNAGQSTDRDKKNEKTASKTKSTKRSSSTATNGNIRNLLGKGYLDQDEQKYYKEHFEFELGCDACQKQQRLHEKKPLCSHRLSRWAPWQTSLQSYSKVGHSNRSKTFCRLMEAAENFRSPENVEDYEKSLAKYVVVSCEKKRTPPSSTTKSAKKTGKDFRKNIINCDSMSEDSDFDLGRKVPPLSKKKQDEMKPCSLEEMKEKIEKSTSSKSSKKSRVRLTRLPNVPKIDLDLSDICDNQIGFCSQKTMPTLFDRCQLKKRKRESMPAFDEGEEDSDYDFDGDRKRVKLNESVDDDDNSLNGERDLLSDDDESLLNGNLLDEDGNLLNREEHLFSGKENEMKQDKDFMNGDDDLLKNGVDTEDKFWNDDFPDNVECEKNKVMNKCLDDKDCDNGKSQDSGFETIPQTKKKDYFSTDDNFWNDELPENIDEGIKEIESNGASSKNAKNVFPKTGNVEKKTDEYNVSCDEDLFGSSVLFDDKNKNKENCAQFLPYSTPANRKLKKKKLNQPPDIGEAIPEAPNDLDLSSFVFETQPQKSLNKSISAKDDQFNRPVEKVSIDVETDPGSSNRKSLFNLQGKKSLGIKRTLPFETPFNQKDKTEKTILNYKEKHRKPGKSAPFKTPYKQGEPHSPEATSNNGNVLAKPGKSVSKTPLSLNRKQKKPEKLNKIETSPLKQQDDDFAMMGDSLLKLFDDVEGVDEFMDDCPPSPPIVSQFNPKSPPQVNAERKQSAPLGKDNINNNNEVKLHGSTRNNIRKDPSKHDSFNVENSKGKQTESPEKDFWDSAIPEENSPLFPKKSKQKSIAALRSPSIDQQSPMEEDSPLFAKKSKSKLNCIFESQKSPTSLQSPPSVEDEFVAPEGFPSAEKKVEKISKIKKREAGRYFLEEEAEDEEEKGLETSEHYDSLKLNEYVLDSFINDETLYADTSSEVTLPNGKTPVNMRMIYKQSLMSQKRKDLNFYTPAFKANRNRYKLANLADKYEKFAAMDVSSEAEEMHGLVDEEEEKLFFQSDHDEDEVEGIGLTSEERDPTMSAGRGDETLRRRVKPGRRVKRKLRTIVDSEDEFETKEKTIVCDWFESYTEQSLPKITFDFGIFWQSEKMSSHECPVIVIDSKCLSNSQIPSHLRAKEKCTVIPRSQIACDFIVSRRMGVVKKYLSDISNSSQSNRTNEAMKTLCELYEKPVLIIEKDRVKKNSSNTVHSVKKYYASLLAKLSLSKVTILHSQDQVQTSSLLADLAKNEMLLGHRIAEVKFEKKQILDSLLFIPKMTYPIAMEIIKKYKSFSAIMKTSLVEWNTTLGFLPERKSSNFYFFFQKKIVTDQKL